MTQLTYLGCGTSRLRRKQTASPDTEFLLPGVRIRKGASLGSSGERVEHVAIAQPVLLIAAAGISQSPFDCTRYRACKFRLGADVPNRAAAPKSLQVGAVPTDKSPGGSSTASLSPPKPRLPASPGTTLLCTRTQRRPSKHLRQHLDDYLNHQLAPRRLLFPDNSPHQETTCPFSVAFSAPHHPSTWQRQSRPSRSTSMTIKSSSSPSPTALSASRPSRPSSALAPSSLLSSLTRGVSLTGSLYMLVSLHLATALLVHLANTRP